jgi:hypothetical protein
MCFQLWLCGISNCNCPACCALRQQLNKDLTAIVSKANGWIWNTEKRLLVFCFIGSVYGHWPMFGTWPQSLKPMRPCHRIRCCFSLAVTLTCFYLHRPFVDFIFSSKCWFMLVWYLTACCSCVCQLYGLLCFSVSFNSTMLVVAFLYPVCIIYTFRLNKWLYCLSIQATRFDFYFVNSVF